MNQRQVYFEIRYRLITPDFGKTEIVISSVCLEEFETVCGFDGLYF